MTHHVFAEIVIDDVTAVALAESYGLICASRIHERILFQPDRSRA